MLSYLQEQFAFRQYVQYILPKKRLDSGSPTDISNIALNIGRVMKNCLQSVFGVSPSETVKSLCDLIRTQWRVYQIELTLEDWWKSRKSLRGECTIIFASTTFILRNALSVYMMEPVSTTFESYCGMDEFWQKVGTMAYSDGSFKYPRLFALIKCVLSLSHGNTVPERGFSVNASMPLLHYWQWHYSLI